MPGPEIGQPGLLPFAPTTGVTPRMTGLVPSRGTISGSLVALSPVLWRKRMRQAMFKLAAFHVEQQGRSSGRRTVLHQYPKRDQPYAEDMGREAVRYHIVGYVVQRWGNRASLAGPQTQPYGDIGYMPWNYDMARDQLIAALEDPDPGRLVDPYNSRIGPGIYMCERYAVTESRERGGYAQFEMTFVECGQTAFDFVGVNTRQIVEGASNTSLEAVSTILNNELRAINDPNAVVRTTSLPPI